METKEHFDIASEDGIGWEPESADYDIYDNHPDDRFRYSQKKKPAGTTFYVMLGIFFVLLFRISISGISQLRKSIIPEVLQSDSPVLFSFVYLEWCLWVIFGFWSIILALKGSRSAISCLKLCLPFHFISLLVAWLSRLTILGLFASWLPELIILFPLVFYIYLCKSDDIKVLYPKKYRNLGLPGLIGIILYLGLAIVLVFGATSGLVFLRKVDPSLMQLNENELTDGRIIFTREDSWILDTIVTTDSIEKTYYFEDTISNAKVRVSSYKEEIELSRHNYIYSITECVPDEIVSGFISEIGYSGRENKDNAIFIDQYKSMSDSATYYWTYASIISKKVERSVRLSILEKDSLTTTIDNAEAFLIKTSFDTRSRLLKKNRVDQEDSNQNTNHINNPTQTITEHK